MSKTFSFDHLVETVDYNELFYNEKVRSSAFDFLLYLKDQLPVDVYSIYITNYTLAKINSIIYICRLDRSKIEFYEKTRFGENHILYDIYDEDISLDSKKMSVLYKTFFKRRMSEIVLDVKNQKSVVFEEKL